MKNSDKIFMLARLKFLTLSGFILVLPDWRFSG